jgi:hypothetical protein
MFTGEHKKFFIFNFFPTLVTSYIIICDIVKMGDNYDFYKDPQSLENFSVFTDKSIPKECIQIMSLKDFYKL